MKKFWRLNSDSSGNALFAVFGAVVLVGLVGASVSSFLKGPLTSSVKQTRMNVAKSQMQIAAQIGVMASAADNTNAQEPYARVFLISQTPNGNLGGLAGADSGCQTLANMAGLPGTYLAWLSDATASPSTRFTKLNAPYKRVDGVLIANNWTDLTDGTIAAPINVTETGGLRGAVKVATGTNADGTPNITNTCSNWTSSSTGVQFSGGRGDYTNSGWSVGQSDNCGGGVVVRCFQQSATSDVSISPSGDCDGDGTIEPLEWTLASGGIAVPPGGGLIPSNIGISAKDPWGTPYGYCSWDYGSTRLASGCQQTSPGTNRRLSGSATDNTAPVVAIISAGPDRQFTTTCRSYATADVNSNGNLNDNNDLALVGKTTPSDPNPSDDVIFTYTYDQAVAASGGLWSLKSGNQVVASTKNIEAQTAKFSGSGLFQSLAASVGTFVDAVSGIRLADPTKATLCDAANAYSLRRNATNDGIEICNGTTWIAIAGGSGGSGTAPVIDAPPATQNRVFVTSQTYRGNLGGLSGADQKCQRHADKAGLPGKYMAWLADDSGSPNTRFNKSTVPYIQVDGTTIANNWPDLIDGTIAVALSKNESGGAVPTTAWTNVGPTNGNAVFSGSNGSCNNWSISDVGVTNGGWSNTGLTNSNWSHTTRSDCIGSRGLICVQQTEGSTSIPSSSTSAGAIDELTDSTSDYTSKKLYIGAGSGTAAGSPGASHVAFGLGALTSAVDYADYLTAFGYQAFPNATGWNTTAFGAQTLSLATNEGNTAVGYQAMHTAPDNSLQNTAIGALTLNKAANGNNYTAMGYQAGKDGGAQTAFGAQASANTNPDSGNSVAIGYQSSYSTTGGYYNVSVGSKAGYANTLSLDFVAVGNYSMQNSDLGDANTGNTLVGNNTLSVATTTGIYNTLLGHNSGRYMIGEGNTGIGKDALMGSASVASTGGSNTAIGSQALKSNTGGENNTAAGYGALMSNTTGSYNSAAGYLALSQITNGNENAALGVFALYSLTSGDYNAAAGYQALKGLTTGTENTAIGYNAGLGITSGNGHTLVGSETQLANVSGGGITAVGYRALKDNTGTYNTAMGHLAGTALVSGGYNVIIGSKALLSTTQGAYNTAVGYKAMANGGGIGNTAIGANALLKGSGSDARYGYNTAIGESALASLTASGTLDQISYSTALGYQALMNTTQGVNTVAGYQAMKNNTTGTANTAAGTESLSSNIGGSYNSALGAQTLYNNTYGSLNTAIGYQALYNNKGSYNTAIGYEALKGTTSILGGGASCSGLGAANVNDPNTGHCYFRTTGAFTATNAASICTSNSAGSYPAVISSAAEQALVNGIKEAGTNQWIGAGFGAGSVVWQYGDMKDVPIYGANTDVSIYTNWSALPTSIVTSSCMAIDSSGKWVYYATSCNTASYKIICEVDPSSYEQSFNTALGYQALTANASGSYNTALGTRALRANQSGSYNTAIGFEALGNTGLTTGSYNTAIGNGAGPNGNFSNTTSIGYGATTTADNNIRLGNASITAISGQVAITSPSDKRLKKDIEPTDLGLDFIMSLKPVSYRLKKGNGRLDYGFIAQDLEEALEGRVTNMLTRRDDEMHTYEMRATDIQAPLIKALQEQEAMIEKLEQKVAQLKMTRRMNYCHAGSPAGGRE